VLRLETVAIRDLQDRNGSAVPGAATDGAQSRRLVVVAVVIATANKRKSRSFGVALFAWFFFVRFYDLIVLGVSLFFKGQTANTILFLSLFANPVDMVRVASLIILDNAAIFGAAGAARAWLSSQARCSSGSACR
jgi:hypothetical protein